MKYSPINLFQQALLQSIDYVDSFRLPAEPETFIYENAKGQAETKPLIPVQEIDPKNSNLSSDSTCSICLDPFPKMNEHTKITLKKIILHPLYLPQVWMRTFLEHFYLPKDVRETLSNKIVKPGCECKVVYHRECLSRFYVLQRSRFQYSNNYLPDCPLCKHKVSVNDFFNPAERKEVQVRFVLSKLNHHIHAFYKKVSVIAKMVLISLAVILAVYFFNKTIDLFPSVKKVKDYTRSLSIGNRFFSIHSTRF